MMVVFVDMLILINFITDYFLLKAVAKLMKTFTPLWRLLLAAFVSALFSLYIFLPDHSPSLQALSRLIFCAVIILVGFGFKSINFYIKACLYLFFITFAYAGVMWAIYSAVHPQKMAVKNGVVYFDISPLALILSAAVFYLLLSAAGLIFPRAKAQKDFVVTLVLSDRKKTFSGFDDSGNKLTDPFGGRTVIIVNREDILPLAGEEGFQKNRFCLLPCGTVTGSALLEGYRLDKAIIKRGSKTAEIYSPIAAFATEKTEKDRAIINLDNIF